MRGRRRSRGSSRTSSAAAGDRAAACRSACPRAADRRRAGRGRRPGRHRSSARTGAAQSADGRVLLGGATPTDKGVWLPGGGGVPDDVQSRCRRPVPAVGEGAARRSRQNQLEPHTRCKPSGFVRQFLTPYGVEFVELPEIQRDLHLRHRRPAHVPRRSTWTAARIRRISSRRYYGHSIGWWEGDTLVVDTIGFNEGFWMDRRGSPHTEKLHTLERFTRTDSATIKYEMTRGRSGRLHDARGRAAFNLRWEDGTELFEYVCQQANYAPELMVGGEKSVDRTSTIVP